MNIIDDIIKVLETNPSKDLPYHNNAHMFMVYEISAAILDASILMYGHPRDPEELDIMHTGMCIAALMHDYGHSGGHEPDTVNVSLARTFTRQTLNRLYDENDYFLDRESLIKTVDWNIACTQYPFVITPLSLGEKALRDADLLYPTLSFDPRVIMEGLRSEMQVARGTEITYEEMLEGQREFASKAVLYTDIGRTMYDKAQPVFMDLLEDYVRQQGKRHA